MKHEYIVGKPLRFNLRDRPHIVYLGQEDWVQRRLMVFGCWLIPLSRKRRVA